VSAVSAATLTMSDNTYYLPINCALIGALMSDHTAHAPFIPLRGDALYSPNQTSEMLKIPQSTLRRYAQQYADHLSEHATKQRNRRYTEQDIATLARARELLREGKSPEQVNNLLGVVGSTNANPDTALALIPSISQALTEALDTARSLRAEVDIMHGDITSHDERMSEAERKLSEMAAKLAQIESDKNTPWYRKITRLIKREHTQ